MSTGVLHSLFSDHCGSYGPGCHILSGNSVLCLAHLDHAKQMGLAPFASDIVDNLLAGEPAVHKQIVEAQMLDGSIVEHLLHAGYLVLEIFLLAFFNLGLGIAHLLESSLDILLGKSLRSRRHSSFLSKQGEVNEHLCTSVSTAEEQPFVAEDAPTVIHMGENPTKHLALAAGLRHVGIVNDHTGGIFGVPGVRTCGNVGGKFLVDIAENVAPVNSLIGKNAIEYVLMAVKEGLKRTANIVRNILYGEEREENHHLDHLSAGELAVWFLFESHLPFRDVYGSKNVHYPLCAESAATFCEKIAQLRNYLSIFVHARCIFLFGHSNILRINEMTKYFGTLNLAFFV